MGATKNEDFSALVTLTLDVASVAANITVEQTFPLPGLKVGDFVTVNKPSINANLGICSSRVSAVDQIAITFVNPSAGAVNPAPEEYTILVHRPERAYAGSVPAL